jgi:pimeloyl-ACP methyl ester carboxylesterase
MAPVARELSKKFGVLEPLQTKDSINGQVDELYDILKKHAEPPITLIGHSWGGFLSIIFTTQYPEMVQKLILISSGPFEDKCVKLLKETRDKRLTEKEKIKTISIENDLRKENDEKNVRLLERLGNLTSRADSYHPIPSNSEVIEYNPEIFSKVWDEAVQMRSEGKFIDMIKNIKCPVIAIHGDYDPHPYEAVKEPFTKYVNNFRFKLLEKCGHYPWLEKFAKDKFYEVINEII